MKRIALTLAALALTSGAAFAAPASTSPAATAAPAHKTHSATPLRSMADAQRMTKALNLIEAQGYGSFNDFKADGKNYSAVVTQNGKTMTIFVDPDAAKVTTQS